MRNYSRAWDCLLVAMILLNVLAWIWFPMTMLILTAISFIATVIYVVVSLELDRNARKRSQRLMSSCVTAEVLATTANEARERMAACLCDDDTQARQRYEGMSRTSSCARSPSSDTPPKPGDPLARLLWPSPTRPAKGVHQKGHPS